MWLGHLVRVAFERKILFKQLCEKGREYVDVNTLQSIHLIHEEWLSYQIAVRHNRHHEGILGIYLTPYNCPIAQREWEMFFLNWCPTEVQSQ